MTIDERLERITQHPFRAKFHLRGQERALVQLRGAETIRRQARDLIAARVAPVEPHKDGAQTPYRGHPVFVAQHATATCCRGCLEKWHAIPRGEALTDEEQAHVIAAVDRWLRSQLEGGGG